MQAALRAKGYDVAISNAGINGDTTAGALKRFDAAIGPDTKIAIVEFGINDLRHGVSGKALRANLSEIVRTLRKRGIEVLIVGLGQLDLSDVAKANGAPYAQWICRRTNIAPATGCISTAKATPSSSSRCCPRWKA